MKTPPRDLDPERIARAMVTEWDKQAVGLEYAPLGFGSHHWIAETADDGRWFITIDDLLAEHLPSNVDRSFRQLESAFGVATRLRHDVGLPFIVAPIATGDGRVLYRLADRYSMALFPHLDVIPAEFGAFQNEEDRIGALRLVARVHAASAELSVEGLRQDSLALPGREAFEETLRDTDKEWTGGPYAEPARKLVRLHANDVLTALDRFDSLVADVMADASRWVITHGEPHAANIVRTTAGEQMVVDWDTVALAPPERDLWMLIDEQHADWSTYREVTGVRELSDAALAAYRLHWDLSEIAIYLAWSRSPHGDTEEMRIAWRELRKYLESMA